MRFVLRSVIGLILLAASAGLIVYAWTAVDATLVARDDAKPRRAVEERVFAVEIDRVALGPATPVIEAFGEIRSWRTLELRAAA
ncbi:MAG: efflux transporter periplasmic adaptor subunit, partial [Pseudomonadota bacterium]